MIGHLGFSYVGLVYLLMLWIPNAIWSKNKPIDYRPDRENRVLLIFERAGQVCCTCCVLIFNDLNMAPFSGRSLWLIASFFSMILYELNWIRYFLNEHTEENFYRSFCGIPVPLRVYRFSFLVVRYLRKCYLADFVSILLGIGHIEYTFNI